jgi:hypothetical protein
MYIPGSNDSLEYSILQIKEKKMHNLDLPKTQVHILAPLNQAVDLMHWLWKNKFRMQLLCPVSSSVTDCMMLTYPLL